ncbi:MAG: hypothetical protein QME71_03570 [Dehalococcoidia bacterium]|nr:hypothetical protein [Dehalococcoidia bacterium]
MIRFMYLFNYADGMSKEEGEDWYLTQHVPAIKELPGVVRFRSWKQWDAGIPFPSAGAPTPFDQFVRRTEVCFDDHEQGIAAILANSKLWTPAPERAPGFREIECMFLTEEPEFDLLRDAPQQHYKYMSLPLWWPRGRPKAEDAEPIFIDSYCFFYRPEISFEDGEDWYIGHHTREGKQLPGMRHYKTWRTIRVPEPPGSPLRPNRWVRMTELGMSPANYRATMVDEETRIRFTPSPVSPRGVIGGWLNISIKPDDYDEF